MFRSVLTVNILVCRALVTLSNGALIAPLAVNHSLALNPRRLFEQIVDALKLMALFTTRDIIYSTRGSCQIGFWAVP